MMDQAQGIPDWPEVALQTSREALVTVPGPDEPILVNVMEQARIAVMARTKLNGRTVAAVTVTDRGTAWKLTDNEAKTLLEPRLRAELAAFIHTANASDTAR